MPLGVSLAAFRGFADGNCGAEPGKGDGLAEAFKADGLPAQGGVAVPGIRFKSRVLVQATNHSGSGTSRGFGVKLFMSKLFWLIILPVFFSHILVHASQEIVFK